MKRFSNWHTVVYFAEEKTKELQKIIKLLESAGDAVLLRHGDIRKTYSDAAAL